MLSILYTSYSGPPDGILGAMLNILLVLLSIRPIIMKLFYPDNEEI